MTYTIVKGTLACFGGAVVYIEFRTTKLKKDCEDLAQAQARWDADAARVIMRRLVQVQAAECLQDLTHEPPIRRHKLSGDRAGQYSLALVRGLRLILQPISSDGESDLVSDPSRVTRVRIMEVIDYHD
jgi:proteic killer suppression protein